jgi:prepilin-type processing-associated H-X9-DG protein
MPKVFAHPSARDAGPDVTVFQVFTGPQTTFPPGGKSLKLAEITDGTSSTVLVTEAATAVPWTKPDDLVVTPGQPLPALGGHPTPGYNLLFADGSVRWMPKPLPETTLRKLITPTGNEPIGPGELP